MNFRKYLVLLSIVVFGSIGDSFLKRGMQDAGSIDVHNLAHVFSALGNVWIILGIFSLLAFMASYMTALSFADLTFVLPATAVSYVCMALISHFWLGEHIGLLRWAGIVLIVAGVGIVSGGPSRTEHAPSENNAEAVGKGA